MARGTPFTWAFQILWVAHFVSLPFIASVYTLFLVIIPVWDTDKVCKVSQSALPLLVPRQSNVKFDRSMATATMTMHDIEKLSGWHKN